jgi:hypothetical protein
MLLACAATANAADGAGVGGKNNQIVVVKGSVVNKAAQGAAARVNVGSVSKARVGGTNNQVVVVGGSIVNQASGNGSKSEVNIGSVSGGND